MADMTMDLAHLATAMKTDQIQSDYGIKTLKMAMDTQQDTAAELLDAMGKSAYQAIGKGQNLDIFA